MNFIKRQLAIVVMSIMGFIALSGYFINSEVLRNFTDKDATNFYMIIAGFAAILGCLNLLQLHLQKIAYKKENWQYSIFTLLGFLIMIIFGFVYKGGFGFDLKGDPFDDFNRNGIRDTFEPYEDINGNGRRDIIETFQDANNNNQYDYGELFSDLNNNNKWDDGFCKHCKTWLIFFVICEPNNNKSECELNNQVWIDAEPYDDSNFNGLYDKAELYNDFNNNGKWDNDLEPFEDTNNDGKWNDTPETFTDLVGNYEYDINEQFNDTNNNGEWNFPESFIDGPDGSYTPPIKWGAHLKHKQSSFYWMFNYFYLPLGATMFALLAFFVASASYRAFRIRNFEATLLLISGVLLMLGRVPIGALIPWWVVTIVYTSILFAIIAPKINDRKIFFLAYFCLNILVFIIGLFLNWSQNTPAIFSIPLIQEWIMAVPATAGSRAIMIGIALGIVAQSYRIMTGRERSILGD